MANFLKDIFKVDKPIIGMVHLRPLPGSPHYDPEKSIEDLAEAAIKDAKALENGGMDGILVSNESDIPYLFQVGPETVASMTYLAARVKEEVSIPVGIDVLWGDAKAALAIAKVLGSKFIRTLMSGVYASDLGLINTNGAEVMRYRKFIGADDIKLFVYINPEFAAPLSPRPLSIITKTLSWLTMADAYCVSGPMPGMPPDIEELKRIRSEVPDVPLIANTGMNKDNVAEYLKYVDGVIVGTSLKVGGVTLNPVDEKKVVEFMKVVNSVRS
ncbi:MAG: BtpA/SgcQ family protein [Thaumarchaeota archaeon]|nr:BtpA/SgcQ family protein [Nitrososphaerota archaeon]